MTIDGSNNLLLDTSASIETTIYLKASTASGTSPAYLPLVISVGATALSNALNQPPFFDPEPENVKLTLLSVDEVQSKDIVFPEPQD